MEEDYRAQRREYAKGVLSRDSLLADPLQQFFRWLAAAQEAGLEDATAFTLATADDAGRPSARIVLLKSASERGFVFFTDYGSRKGQHLAANPHAEMLFYWREFERQVRITGMIERLSEAESDAYFASRPRDSQVSAAVSEQSQPVASRAVLEDAARVLAKQAEIQRPMRWGGYSLAATRYEFWQGREGRLHDRFSYTPLPGENWEIVRLQP